jgi:hypothetical protein
MYSCNLYTNRPKQQLLTFLALNKIEFNNKKQIGPILLLEKNNIYMLYPVRLLNYLIISSEEENNKTQKKLEFELGAISSKHPTKQTLFNAKFHGYFNCRVSVKLV